MVGSDWDCFLGALFNRFFKGYQEKWVKKKTHKIAKIDLLLILLKFDHFGQLCSSILFPSKNIFFFFLPFLFIFYNLSRSIYISNFPEKSNFLFIYLFIYFFIIYLLTDSHFFLINDILGRPPIILPFINHVLIIVVIINKIN